MDFLSVVWNVDPIICRIGPLALRYYSILFVLGFPIGYWLFVKFYKREKVNTDLLEPLLYALLIGTIVGARLGHCLFYQPDYFLTKAHWLEISSPGRAASPPTAAPSVSSSQCGGTAPNTARRTISI